MDEKNKSWGNMMEAICEKNIEGTLKDHLYNILKNKDISTVYQPIVSLINGEVIGYEALSRGPQYSPLKNPNLLFEIARKYNKTWDVEYLCREKAIERAKSIPKNKLLFINVDPKIFKDEKFKKGFTKEFIEKNNISYKNIIFEITEKTVIEDYNSFNKALRNYTEQGFKIAIDDTGAGYSGLKTINEVRPHFVKIDMDIIRGIDKDGFKQSMMEAIVKLSLSTNMKLIAEGIETKEELTTLINLGVYAGQGYYLSKPKKTFCNIENNIKNKILRINKIKNKFNLELGVGCIGDISRCDKAFNIKEKCKDIKELFDNSDITGACVIDNEYPVGLIMKHSLNSAFSKLYGNAVFNKQPISTLMDKRPLIVDYYTSTIEVSRAAMKRKSENVYDYIIVTKDDKYYGIVTVKILLHYTTMIESNYARHLNPLSQLPGNYIIDRVLQDSFQEEIDHCVLYFDLDNFKIYNDTYGFENGDKIIKYTSNLIKNNIRNIFGDDGFLGHIGGDDFIFIIENKKLLCEKLCNNIIIDFDKNIKSFYNEEDIKNGYIEGKNRNGEYSKFDFTSISIAGMHGIFNDIECISEKISKVKKEVKNLNGSNYLIKLHINV